MPDSGRKAAVELGGQSGAGDGLAWGRWGHGLAPTSPSSLAHKQIAK